jgi:mono/diheme cytochrome c family protein
MPLGLLTLLALLAEPGELNPQPGDLLWMIEPGDGAPTRPQPRPSDELRARGRKIYESYCASCHGAKGNGRGPAAAAVRPRPTDFTSGVYKLRSTPTGSLPTDADLFGSITRGLHGTAMPAWRRLDETDRWALALHLKSFSRRFREERPLASIMVPVPPRETDTLRGHGERLYQTLRCAACHGETGAGDGPGRQEYRRSGDRQVHIRDFTRGRFIRGSRMEDIYVTLKVGVEGTPMGPYEVLDDDELWALAAHVRFLVGGRKLHELPAAGTQAPAVTITPQERARLRKAGR